MRVILLILGYKRTRARGLCTGSVDVILLSLDLKSVGLRQPLANHSNGDPQPGDYGHRDLPAMTDQLVAPVILCSGAGTRLWPVSRGEDAEAVRAADRHVVDFSAGARPRDPRRPVRAAEQARSRNVKATIIFVLRRRDSAAAIAAAAELAIETDPGAIPLVVAADRHIPDTEGRRPCPQLGRRRAKLGVTRQIKSKNEPSQRGVSKSDERNHYCSRCPTAFQLLDGVINHCARGRRIRRPASALCGCDAEHRCDFRRSPELDR